MSDYADLGFVESKPPVAKPTPYDDLGFVETPPEPDMKPLKDVFAQNHKAVDDERAQSTTPKEAHTFAESIEAGWQISVAGLLKNQKAPDMVLPEDAPRFYKIASQISSLAGDLPAMWAGAEIGGAGGALAGGAVGSVVPVAGTATGAVAGAAVGGGYGAFALPAGIRKVLMDHYEKGDIKDASDFWDRAAATFIESNKQGLVGAATAGVGGVVGKVAGGVAGGMAKTTAQLTSEVATMVTVGKAIEGELPNSDDFINAAILVGGMHGVMKAGPIMRRAYSEGNIKPEKIAEQAMNNPLIKQDLLAEGPTGSLPKSIAQENGIPIRSELTAKEPTTQEPVYNYQPFDVGQPTGGKVFYHGTKAPIESLSKAGPLAFSHADSIYGEGLYLTDNPSVAESYAKTKGKGVGKVLSAELNNLSLLDLEKPMGDKAADIFNSYLEDGQKISPKAKGTLAYDMLREAWADEGIPISEAVERWQDISHKLTEIGYDGVRHEGGNLTKQNLGKHNVVVIFDDVYKGLPEGVQSKLKDVAYKSSSVPAQTIERSEAQTKILSQIGEKVKGASEKASLRGAYKDYVDKLDPINEAVKKLNIDPESLKTEENPYQLGRMANDYKAKTKFAVEKGTLDFKTLAKTGESLESIIKPFAKDPEGFDAYLAAKRAIEVESKGKVSGFDLEAAKQLVKEGAGTYEDAAQRLYVFKNKNLEYLRDSGVVSKAEFDNITELNKAHVSFSRILEDEKGGGGTGPRKLGALKQFKGSEAKIESPLLTTLNNTESIFKIAERNRATTALMDLAAKTKDQNLFERVESKGKLKTEEFELWRNGEREVWATKPDAPVGLAEAIKSLDGDVPAQNMAMKIAKGLTGIKKFSITIVPDFIIKNLFRDQLTMGAFSKGGARPFVDVFSAMGNLIKKDDVYYDWLKSGGAQGTFLDVSRSYLEKNIYKLNEETGFAEKSWNVLKKPVDYLQAAGMLAEHATRLAEFKRVTKGETSGSKIFEGGFSSREVTIDFSRVGAKLSALNSITAFQNMGIQGFDRTVRAIKENPVGVGTKSALLVTAPSLMLWYANKDDKRYIDIPRWQKDLFWIIPVDRWSKATEEQAGNLPEHLVRKNSKGEFEINDGPIFRIPKPQELGLLFGTVPERLFDAFFTDHPDALKGFTDSTLQLLAPSIVPDAVAPVMEQWANKSLFTGNKIVSSIAEKNLPTYQYNEYTTESAKALGKMIRVLPGSESGDLPISSPAVIENYIRSWSGNVGTYVMQVADKALAATGAIVPPIKPTDTVADIPFVKAFVIRYPSSGAQPIQDFYDEYKKHEKYVNTVEFLRKTGDFQGLEKELSNPETQDMLVRLKGINDGLGKLAHTVRVIYNNSEFTADDKRQQIDGLYYLMIETARQGNELGREIEKSQKEGTPQ